MDLLTQMLRQYEAALSVVQKRQAGLVSSGKRRFLFARCLNQIAIGLYSLSVRILKQPTTKVSDNQKGGDDDGY